MTTPKVKRAIVAAALCSTALSPIFGISVAHAQANSPPQEITDTQVEEVVVTGTLIRGVAPAGANTVSLSRDQITAGGKTSTSQLLADVPQVSGSFNQRPTVQGTSTQSVMRPNLRTLPGGNGGGSATLLLMDGHRMPGMGTQQTVPDADALAPGAIDRVEIVTDGGSSIYGADAVGGVINFITRSHFDGVEASARVGFADHYTTTDTNLTAGRTWGNTSLYAAWNFARHDALFFRDRDFARRWDYPNNVPIDLTCAPGNVTVGANIYALPSLALGVGNRCDINKNGTIFPRETRHSITAGFSTEIGSRVKADVKAFYINRQANSYGSAPNGTATILPVSLADFSPNPYYRNLGGADAFATQTVSFSLEPITGASLKGRQKLESWQVAPSATVDLGGSWQLRALASYGRGVNSYLNPTFNSSLVSDLTLNAKFNPYDISAAVNQPNIAQILDYGGYSKGINELTNARAVADGTLLTLPGGAVKAAVGVEAMRETYAIQGGGDAIISQIDAMAWAHAKRTTKAVFGEIQVPIIGDGNALPGVQALSLSASGRYDHYSDFGGTFNPKFGLTYSPASWLRVRGTWGKSFQAPSLADGAGAAGAGIGAAPAVVFPNPNVAPLPGQVQIFIVGGGDALKPQKAKTWTLGLDVNPPGIDNLSIKANYYHINFRDLISIPPIFVPSTFYSLFTDAYIMNPTASQVLEIARQFPGGEQSIAAYAQRDGQVYSIADGRRRNLATATTDGVDLGLDYNRPTSFGAMFVRFNGTYILSMEQQARSGTEKVEIKNNDPRLRLTATAGAIVGPLLAQATFNRLGGYDIAPSAANLRQERVGAVDITNLFFQYDVKGKGLMSDLQLSLYVENVFGIDPPNLREGAGFAQGSNPLGRLIQLGATKRF